MHRIAVLLVCHNRREITLRALRFLARNAGEWELQTVLFDDASSDRTVEAVLDEFPQTIVVRGNGDAYWNGGLHAAWSRALGLDVDGYLWLNDDVALDHDALMRCGDAWEKSVATTGDHKFILVGSTRGAEGELTYGGMCVEPSPFALRIRIRPPASDLLPIDTFNGNIVLVPRQVVETIGINDPVFHHGFGDIDYGLRASRAGIAVRLLAGTLGVCELNREKLLRGYGSPHLSVREQWKKVNTHHGFPFRSWWRFTRRHSGWWFPLHFLLPYRFLVGIRRSRPTRST